MFAVSKLGFFPYCNFSCAACVVIVVRFPPTFSTVAVKVLILDLMNFDIVLSNVPPNSLNFYFFTRFLKSSLEQCNDSYNSAKLFWKI